MIIEALVMAERDERNVSSASRSVVQFFCEASEKRIDNLNSQIPRHTAISLYLKLNSFFLFLVKTKKTFTIRD